MAAQERDKSECLCVKQTYKYARQSFLDWWFDDFFQLLCSVDLYIHFELKWQFSYIVHFELKWQFLYIIVSSIHFVLNTALFVRHNLKRTFCAKYGTFCMS